MPSDKKLRYWRLENSTQQEFVVTEEVEPGPKSGIDLRKWPTRVELTEAEFETRKGERVPDPIAAEIYRRSQKIQFLTAGELEDLIDVRVGIKLAAMKQGNTR